MDDKTKISLREDPVTGRIFMSADIPNTAAMIDRYTANTFIHEVVKKIAERYVEENYVELVAKFDQQAIANLAVADAGKKIAEEIRTQPVVLHDGHKTTVNKYSLF